MEKVMDMLFLVTEIQGGHEDSFGHTYRIFLVKYIVLW